MPNSNKVNTKKSHQKKQKKPTWKEMIIDGKGTVGEAWPTAEQLYNDPDVQNEIKEVREAFKNISDT